MKFYIALLASILAILGNISYLTDVLKNRIKPHPYTWFIWSIVSCVIFFGQLQKGGGIGTLPTGVAESFNIVIFLFSLKYLFSGRKEHIRPIDHIFLVVALLGLIPWWLTKDPTISVIVVVSMDIVAFIPTLRKTWFNPNTEKPTLYGTNVLRHVMILFSLETYNIATTLHSIAMICTNTLMVLFIKRKKK